MEHKSRTLAFGTITFFLGLFVHSSLLGSNKQAVVMTVMNEEATSVLSSHSYRDSLTMMTPVTAPTTVESHLAHWNYSVVHDALEFQSLTMRTKCSDKCIAHRYQEIYARTLIPFRESTQPSKLLEIGLGCHYHKCSLGGPMTFMPFLPRTTYHTLELNVSACKAKYDANHVPVELSRYIDEHACHGSSADVAVVNACSAKFGPFDVVIDDGSHMLKHTSFSFLFWLKSPGLVPGGYLIIEDLQVTSWPDWQSSALDYDAEKHDVRQPA
ncbi:transmembrane protein, putative, partial [Bodo saltans]